LYQEKLLSQLDEIKREAVQAINERDEAERHLIELKNILDQKCSEEDSYIKGLKQALIDTDPERAFKVLQDSKQALTLRESEIDALNFNNPNEVESMARSIALDCQSKFIPVMLMEGMKADKDLSMSKIGNLNVEQLLRDNPSLLKDDGSQRGSNLDSTTKEFEELLRLDAQKRVPSGQHKKKSGDRGDREERSKFEKKRGEGKRGKSRDRERDRGYGSDSGMLEVDSEDVIRNLDEMMNDYLKRRG
jgi:hypothetical protein